MEDEEEGAKGLKIPAIDYGSTAFTKEPLFTGESFEFGISPSPPSATFKFQPFEFFTQNTQEQPTIQFVTEKKNKSPSRRKRNSPKIQEKFEPEDPQKISDSFSKLNISKTYGVRKYEIDDLDFVLDKMKDHFWLKMYHEHIGESLKKEPKFIIKSVQKDHMSFFKEAGPQLLSNVPFLLKVLQFSKDAFQYIDPSLKSDKEFISLLASNYVLDFNYLSDEMKNDPDMVKIFVQYGIIKMNNINEDLKRNREFLLSLPGATFSLEYVDKSLCEDKEFVIQGIAINASKTLPYCKKELLKDDDVIEAIFSHMKTKNVEGLLEYCDERMRTEKQFGLRAVQISGMNLKHLSDELRSDKEIVLSALDQTYRSFDFIAEQLMDDDDVALKAISVGCSISMINIDNIKSKSVIGMKAVENGQPISALVLAECFGDVIEKEFAIKLVKLNPHTFNYVQIRFSHDEDVVLTAMSKNLSVLKQASQLLTDSRDFALKAVSLNGYALQYLTNFTDDKEIVMKAVLQKASSIQYVTGDLLIDEDVCLVVVRKRGSLLGSLDEKMKSSLSIVNAAIENHPMSLRFASDELKNDKKLVMKAIKLNPQAFQVAGADIKTDVECCWKSKRYHMLIRSLESFKNLKFNFCE